MPVLRISDSKFLFGTVAKSVQIRSDKLYVQVGGGFVPLEEHWRATAVSEILKLNKLVQQTRLSPSKVIKGVAESMTAQKTVVNDFMAFAATFDELFVQQDFILQAWSKRQISEQEARNSRKSRSRSQGKKKKVGNSPPSVIRAKLVGSAYPDGVKPELKIKKVNIRPTPM